MNQAGPHRLCLLAICPEVAGNVDTLILHNYLRRLRGSTGPFDVSCCMLCLLAFLKNSQTTQIRQSHMKTNCACQRPLRTPLQCVASCLLDCQSTGHSHTLGFLGAWHHCQLHCMRGRWVGLHRPGGVPGCIRI